MSKKNLSIEYAHIYTDEEFNIEHTNSVKQLHKLEDWLGKDYDITRLILIDDYSPDEDTLDQNGFMHKLDDIEGSPDFVVNESAMAEVALEFLATVHKARLKKSYDRYIESKGGYIPCSLFIATWYMIRLGLISTPEVDIPIADRTITVLPSRFRNVEERGIELIRNSDYAESVRNIEQYFFDEHHYERSPKF